jgi:hypothetical protein
MHSASSSPSITTNNNNQLYPHNDDETSQLITNHNEYYISSSPIADTHKGRVKRRRRRRKHIQEDIDHSQDSTLKKIKQFVLFLGPAVLVSVGYVDPGNCMYDITTGILYSHTHHNRGN